jgi:hypothetical protein
MDSANDDDSPIHYGPVDPAILLESIETEFANVQKPRCTLRMARAADDNEYDAIAERRAEDDYYSHWNQISQADIERYHDVWLWLEPVGVQFYLPAFMSHSLSREKPKNALWLDCIFGAICFKAENFTGFTDGQKIVIHEFLTSLLEPLADESFPDWWNHPWHVVWKDDHDKARDWQEYEKAFRYFEGEVIRIRKRAEASSE